jgi:flagellar hook assembly protein FlgD
MVVFGGRSTTDGILNDVWSLENLSDTPTGVRPVTAGAATLAQNYPNPFNPTTVIEYQTRSEGTVRLGVFDAAGRTVRTLVDEVQPRGVHTVAWDGRNDAGATVASGVYLYRLEVEGTKLTRKMMLLK